MKAEKLILNRDTEKVINLFIINFKQSWSNLVIWMGQFLIPNSEIILWIAEPDIKPFINYAKNKVSFRKMRGLLWTFDRVVGGKKTIVLISGSKQSRRYWYFWI